MTCASVIFYYFHDQFWWPVDEGVYAYVAQRANAGAVIHRDIIDLHSGYGNLLNSTAFRWFGEDLLSLRYPLVALALFQCVATIFLLPSKNPLLTFVAIVTVASFSFVQFLNPSSNWHALGAFFALCLILEKMNPGSSLRLLLAGFIVGLCFFIRQLSGVFLGIGLICFLVWEAPQNSKNPRLPALLIGAFLISALSAYLFSKQQAFGLVWSGLWSVGLLALINLRARISWIYTIRMASLTFAGFVLAGLPLCLTAIYNGSLAFWLSDIFFTALTINNQEFIANASYLHIVILALQNIFNGAGVVAIFSSLNWIALLLTVPAVGYIVCMAVARSETVAPTPILSVFWVTGALHYQIPIYLFFVVPAALLALLILRPNLIVSSLLVILSIWGLTLQAGQPLDRGIKGAVSGEIGVANEPANLPRVSLRIQPDDAAIFREIVAAIETSARPDEKLMTIPMEPELNFILNRASPVRYYGTPLGLREVSDVSNSLEALDAAAPLLVVHRRNDKYLTPLSAVLLEAIKERSDRPVQIGPFDLYRYRVLPNGQR